MGSETSKVEKLELIIRLQAEAIRGLENLLQDIPFVLRSIADTKAVAKNFSREHNRAMERLEELEKLIASLG